MTDRQSIVLLHGWGSTPAVWDEVADGLSSDFQVIKIALPGHDGSKYNSETLLLLAREVIADVERMVAGDVVWLGWSLGGLLAIQVALLKPDLVSALLLVAATPLFTQKKEWHTAMPVEEFDAFYSAYQQDPEKTLQRFIALQSQGDNQLRQVMKSLKAASASAQNDLIWGLDCLKTGDMREQLNKLSMPVHGLYGAKDALVPAGLSVVLKDQYSINSQLWQSVGHAPFLSRPSDFIHWVKASVQGGVRHV